MTPDQTSSPAPPQLQAEGSSDDFPKSRRYLGYGLGTVAILGVVGLVGLAFCELSQAPKAGITEREYLVQLGARAGVTMAAVFFLYQLLRAAERLLLPYSWVQESPEAAKVLLGITDPLSATKQAVELVSAVKK